MDNRKNNFSNSNNNNRYRNDNRYKKNNNTNNGPEIDKNDRFVYPYNFVSFPDKVDRNDYKETVGELTGYIDCSIDLKTPMALPDVESEIKKDRKATEYDFYKIAGNPVIPGSSIRGCLRNIYETATNSCVSKIFDGELSFRDSKPAKPGMLQWNGKRWILKSAKRYKYLVENKFAVPPYELVCNGETFENLEEVYFNTQKAHVGDDFATNVVKLSEGCGPGMKKGTILLWIYSSRKTVYKSIFVSCDSSKGDNFSEDAINEAVKNLKRLIEIYVENDKNKIVKKLNYKIEKDGKEIPVWYRIVGGRLYLSPASLGRRMNYNMLEKFLGDVSACKGRNSVCPACAMFGFAGNGKGAEIASSGKLLISDATISRPVVYYNNGERVLLREMATPHISSMELYTSLLEQFKGVSQITYDYLDNINGGEMLKPDYKYLNGRKFYWHNTYDRAFVGRPEVDDNERCSKMQLLDKGNKFSFRISFDRLTEDALADLLWCITLSDNNPDSRYCLKLGHGKAIGLGSVKITALNCVIREFNSSGYKLCAMNIDSLISAASERMDNRPQVREIKTITDIGFSDKLPDDVQIRWPYGFNKGVKSFEWFAGNGGKIGKPPKQKLKLLRDCTDPSDYILYGYKKAFANKDPNNRGTNKKNNRRDYKNTERK